MLHLSENRLELYVLSDFVILLLKLYLSYVICQIDYKHTATLHNKLFLI